MVWKIPVLIGKKAKEDYDGVVKALRKNYYLMQLCYKNLILTQYFPNVVSKTFWEFIKKCKIPDKILTEKQYHIAFERVNFEEDDDEENPADELCRYEFMELIVRVAGKKYNIGKKTDPDKPALCKTYTEALNRLIEEHLEVYFEPYPDAEFRTKYLWTLGCHNVFTSNLEILKDLFKKCN